MIYKNGYIYKIDNGNSIYYGSTTRNINNRYAQHINAYNRFKNYGGSYISSFALFETGNMAMIALVETLTNVTKQELLQCERSHIEKNECINVNMPYRTYAEKLQYSRDYHRQNFTHINDRKNEKVLCNSCNRSVSRTNITHHYKSKKHQNLINI